MWLQSWLAVFFFPAVIGVDALQQPLCAFTLHHSTLVSGESDVPM